jgi:hypothetical protein
MNTHLDMDKINDEMLDTLLRDDAEEYFQCLNKYFANSSEFPWKLGDALVRAYDQPNCFHAVYQAILENHHLSLHVVKNILLNEYHAYFLEGFFEEDKERLAEISAEVKGHLVSNLRDVDRIGFEKLLVLYRYDMISWRENEFVYEYCIDFHESLLENNNEEFIGLCKSVYSVRHREEQHTYKPFDVDYVEELVMTN